MPDPDQPLSEEEGERHVRTWQPRQDRDDYALDRLLEREAEEREKEKP